MNVWKLTGAGKLIHGEAALPEHEEGKLRVRVTKVMVNGLDAAIYSGRSDVKYPIIPGRYAVGMVSEDGDGYFPRGTRVLLHTFRPADTDGTQRRDFSAPEFEICGRTADGFLSDFVSVSPRDMTALPDSVSDRSALLLHHVALAKAISDSLDAAKGKHIAVVGANLTGILLCQLLIYQQAAPILVDASESNIAFARKCGIYYAMTADEHTMDEVASLTGGRLADGTAYISTAAGNSPELAFSLTARESNVVVYGSGHSLVSLDLTAAFRKHTTIHCVSNGHDYLPTAVNLMANKAVDLSFFRANDLKPTGLEALLKQYAERQGRDTDMVNFVDMV